VAMSDENRKSVLVYDRTGGDKSAAVTAPLREILASSRGMGTKRFIRFTSKSGGAAAPKVCWT